jgi:hypothetical protein
MNGWSWMISIKSSLAVSICAQALRYCSSPSAGLIRKKASSSASHGLRRIHHELHINVCAVAGAKFRFEPELRKGYFRPSRAAHDDGLCN